jgi:hypothetical protein
VHLCQKVPFVLAYFQASAAPRPENSHSDEKDTLFGLNTQITIYFLDFNDFFLFCRYQKRSKFFKQLLIVILLGSFSQFFYGLELICTSTLASRANSSLIRKSSLMTVEPRLLRTLGENKMNFLKNEIRLPKY